MEVISIPLRVPMPGDTQFENISEQVRQALASTGLLAGIVTVFIKHTTASVLRQIDASASALAAVPLNTRNTSASASNTRRTASSARAVHASWP